MTPGRRRRSRATEPSEAAELEFECDVMYRADEAVVSVCGNLGLETVARMRRTVMAAAVLPISQVTVDLVGVESVDRYSVNVLISLREHVRDRSSRFVLGAVSAPVRRALVATGDWDLFEHGSVWSEYPPPDGNATEQWGRRAS